MAIITETSVPMNDTAVRSGVQVTFRVIDPDDPMAIAVAVANGRVTPNLRDRVFVLTTFLANRNDGRGSTYRETDAQHVDATNYASLNTNALLVALKVIHDVDQVRAGLA